MMIRAFKSGLLWLCLLLCVAVLGGCDSLQLDNIERKLGLTQLQLISNGWEEPEPEPENPVFCYRTIGGPDCYDSPQPGEEHRLIRDPKPPVE